MSNIGPPLYDFCLYTFKYRDKNLNTPNSQPFISVYAFDLDQKIRNERNNNFNCFQRIFFNKFSLVYTYIIIIYYNPSFY